MLIASAAQGLQGSTAAPWFHGFIMNGLTRWTKHAAAAVLALFTAMSSAVLA
jgi:hypothetical protein